MSLGNSGEAVVVPRQLITNLNNALEAYQLRIEAMPPRITFLQLLKAAVLNRGQGESVAYSDRKEKQKQLSVAASALGKAVDDLASGRYERRGVSTDDLVQVPVAQITALQHELNNQAGPALSRSRLNKRGRMGRAAGISLMGIGSTAAWGTFLGYVVGTELVGLQLPFVGTFAPIGWGAAVLGYSSAAAAMTAGLVVDMSGRQDIEEANRMWQTLPAVQVISRNLIDDALTVRPAVVERDISFDRNVDAPIVKTVSRQFAPVVNIDKRPIQTFIADVLEARGFDYAECQSDAVASGRIAAEIVSSVLGDETKNPAILISKASGQSVNQVIDESLRALAVAQLICPSDGHAYKTADALSVNGAKSTDLRLVRDVGLSALLSDIEADRAAEGGRYSSEVVSAVSQRLVKPIWKAADLALQPDNGMNIGLG